MDGNKVTVKIYGHEYVISGDSSREQIMRVADFVDSKMQEMERLSVRGLFQELQF